MHFKGLQIVPFTLVLIVFLFCNCDYGKSGRDFFELGLTEIKNGNSEKAYRYFKKSTIKEPRNAQFQWAAANVAPNQNDAFIHAKAAWDNGFRNYPALLRLSVLAFHTSVEQKLAYALGLYNDLPDTLKSEEFRGDIFVQFGMPDSSLKIYESLFQKNRNPTLCNKIALCYEKKGKLDSMLTYLEQCKKERILNAQGYSLLISLWAVQYEYVRVDSIYAYAQSLGLINNELKAEYAFLLTVQNRFDVAVELLTEIMNGTARTELIHMKSLINLAYIRGFQNDTNSLKLIIQNVKNDSSSTQESLFCQYLLFRNKDTTNALQKINSIYNKISSDPFVSLLYARELNRVGKYSLSDSLYRRLPQALLVSPPVLTEYAIIKMRQGKDADAIDLISRLHQHNIFSKVSLEIFRDLTYKKNLFEKSSAAQKLLEHKFKDDVKVQWSGALLALNEGKTDSAIVLFTALAKKYPGEEQFKIMRIISIFLKGDYEGVLQECATESLSKVAAQTFRAKAFRKLGRIQDAKNAYEEALKNAKGNKIELTSEYGEFLLECGDQKAAATVFGNLVATYEKNKKIDSVALAILLNNYAWASLQSGIYDKKELIRTAAKAAVFQPQSKDIADTYATILLKTGNYKECIKLLENKEITSNEPKLLACLGQAYEMDGDKNRAVRTYQKVISMPDSVGRLRLSISKVKLEEHVKALQSEK